MEDKKEIVLDVKIDTGKVAQKLGDATNAMRLIKSVQKDLDKALKDGTITSEEYGRAIAANKQSLEQYSREVKSSTALLQAETMARVSDNASLDEQRQVLNAAQKAYGLLSGEEKKAADASGGLRDQINELSDRVKAQEQAIGDARRNVGNYAGSIEDAAKKMGSLGGGLGSVVGPMKNVTMGMKAMSATPLLATLSILIAIFIKLADRFRNNAAAMEKLSGVMGVFSGIGNIVNGIIDKIASGLGWIAEKAFELADKLGILSDKMKEGQAIAKEDIAIQQAQRESMLKNAEDAKKVSELRAKANDKEKYTAAERLKFAKDAGKIEEQVVQRQYDLAKREYDLQVKKNAQSDSSQADLKKENDLKIAMINAEQALFEKRKAVNAQTSALAQESVQRAQAAAAARLEIERKLEDAILSLSRDATEKAITQAQRAGEREVENLRVKLNNLKEEDIKGRELLQQLIVAKEKETQQIVTDIAIQAAAEREQKAREYARAQAVLGVHDAETLAQIRYDAAQEESARLIALSQREKEALFKTEQDYNTALLQAQQEEFDAREALAAEQYAIQQQRMQNEFEERKMQAGENQVELAAIEYEQAVAEQEQLMNLDEETKSRLYANQEQYEAAVIASNKRVNDANKKAVDTQRQMAVANAQAISTAFDAISGLISAVGEENRAAAIAGKAIALARIAISTGTAIAEGVAQSQSVPFPANIAAVATTVATIMANIASAISTVKSAKFEHGGIVGGTSYTGDHVPVMANSREMYLNLDQQTRLFDAINGRGDGSLGINYEAMAAVVSALPAPVMDYTEFKQFEQNVSTYNEIASV